MPSVELQLGRLWLAAWGRFSHVTEHFVSEVKTLSQNRHWRQPVSDDAGRSSTIVEVKGRPSYVYKTVRSGSVVSLLASYQCEPGSILGRIFASGNCAGKCHWLAGFLGDFPFPPTLHSGALHSHLISLSSALKTSLLRAVQISQFNNFFFIVPSPFNVIPAQPHTEPRASMTPPLRLPGPFPKIPEGVECSPGQAEPRRYITHHRSECGAEGQTTAAPPAARVVSVCNLPLPPPLPFSNTLPIRWPDAPCPALWWQTSELAASGVRRQQKQGDENVIACNAYELNNVLYECAFFFRLRFQATERILSGNGGKKNVSDLWEIWTRVSGGVS
ncbi:hypothetical protein PR048_032358 [Dryococelus australis]|uniref:Uncharacterized protein n=1 Tax=Dryococelus australis TaxID=614101 RepID=A0ABQ9G208_9NEOP|nr:hypothetical protein PR048_032358 [Dryococelus australis]